MSEQPRGMCGQRELRRLIRTISSSTELPRTLQAVVDGVLGSLGFGLAVVNLVRDDGDLEVAAAAGDEGAAAALIGQVGRRADWEAVLDEAERWGELRFLGHETHQGPLDPLPEWVPDVDVPAEPDAWHPLDALLAPLRMPDGELVGVLSVDLPRAGRRPDADQRELLEMYAAQAGIAIQNARLADRLRQEREALRASEELFRLAFEGAPIGMAIIDLGAAEPGRFVRVNDALCSMLEYSRPDLLARTVLDVLHPDHRGAVQHALADARAGTFANRRVEHRYLCSTGRLGWASVSAVLIRAADATPPRLVTQVIDITESKYNELRLTRQALHDPLTGLPNRLVLLQRLAHAVQRARRSGAPAVVLFGDLDDFKAINDEYGHHVGDEVLIAIAGRLLAQVRAVDTVARLGGDEFVVLAEDTTAEQGRELLSRLRQALKVPIRTDVQALHVAVSVGLAAVTAQSDVEQVLRSADADMYRAKRGLG